MLVVAADTADVQNCAVFTFDTLAKTLNGVTSPTTVTFFAAKSMLKEETPAQINKRKSYFFFCQNWVDIHSWDHFLIIQVFVIEFMGKKKKNYS